MTIADYCEMQHVEFEDDVILAAAILEARGYRFLVHFGYENAVRFADMVLMGERAPTWTPEVGER